MSEFFRLVRAVAFMARYGVALSMEQIKAMCFEAGQGENCSDTHWYRADSQRGHGPKSAFLCAIKSATAQLAPEIP